MSTYLNDGNTTALFTFNHIIARFRVPKQLVTNHGSHFQNAMMTELSIELGFKQEHSSPYYPQANG
jgi:transposase InsO family protein